jgi:hypothetical protein
MTTYIKDLIDLPEKVHVGDFVLKLTEGVAHPDETLRPYGNNRGQTTVMCYACINR